jgi:hypothetical protein
VLLTHLLSAQSFEWAQGVYGGQFDQVLARAASMDGQAAVITAGEFNTTVDIDPGASVQNITSAGGTDIWIRKCDALGQFLWGVRIGGTAGDQVFALAMDGDGNILLTGRIIGQVDLDPGPGQELVTTQNSGADVFVLKLDAQGNYLWGRVFGGLGTDQGNSLAVDAAGKVITVGVLGNGGDLDPGPGAATVTSAGQQDLFVQKLDAAGNFLWGHAVGGSGNDVAYDVAIGPAGEVVLCGEFRTTVDFDPGPGVSSLTTGGAEDAFVQKLLADGTLIWAHRFGGSGSERARSLVVASDGAVSFTGRITSITDFDPGPGVFELPGANTEDAFIAQLSGAGAFAWAFRLATFLNEGLALAVDADDNLYSTGSFGTVSNTPLDLDPGPGSTPVIANGGGDCWLASYEATGAFRWGFAVGSAQNDVPQALAVGLAGRVALAGSHRQTIDLDPSAAIFNLTTASPSASGAFTAVYGVRKVEAVYVRLKAFLQGAYQNDFIQQRDDLRVAGLLPVNEPYSAMGFSLDDTLQTNALVLTWSLSAAIIDWVLVELRDPLEPATVLNRQVGLLRASGDVVAPDGVSAIAFDRPNGPYRVAIRHRNHLGAMTAVPVALSQSPTTLDFRSPALATWGTDAQHEVNGVRMLWSGNTLLDATLRYTGASNDRDPVLARIGGLIPTNVVGGYWPEDVNLDGLVKYAGAFNDRDLILQNIGGSVPTAERWEQLP